MQKTLYWTADAEVSLSYTDAGDALSDSGCRSLPIRQWMQETLYQTAGAEVSLPLSDRVSLASAL